MSKHSEAFKRSVVEFYQTGERGAREVGRRFGVDHATVRTWVASYAAHGPLGLAKKFSRYDTAFKLSVLQRMWEDGLSYRQTAALFDIRNKSSLADWERRYKTGGIDALSPRRKGRPRSMPEPQKQPDASRSDDKSREELLAELTYLRMENAYLKKLGCLNAGASSAQKAQVIQALRPFYPIDSLLKLSGLSRSTFYYRQKVSALCDKHAALKDRIKAVFHAHKGRYGYRRVTAEIRQEGHRVNHKTVQHLMVKMGLKSLVRPKKYRSYKGSVGRIAPDLIKRQFTAQAVNQKWVTDVTEFNVGGEKLYLSPVMDLFNGEIIAFETARRPVFKLVEGMLSKALNQLGNNDKPILHSDQGWHYQMSAYQQRLKKHGIQQSMSRKGNCLDNAAMESFFATLKSELFYPNRFESTQSLKNGIKDYIHYYNHQRIKLKLKGLSPVQYRTQSLVS
ncbi:IS3 family transposase [Rhizobium sp. YTU87027]|uniref:IS3 family transposase n=1 Tax=Rhizobium sp. YTU87027 TaxID=3417741 RepID=UPI003D68616E